jgi:hypothetical protein
MGNETKHRSNDMMFGEMSGDSALKDKHGLCRVIIHIDLDRFHTRMLCDLRFQDEIHERSGRALRRNQFNRLSDNEMQTKCKSDAIMQHGGQDLMNGG